MKIVCGKFDEIFKIVYFVSEANNNKKLYLYLGQCLRQGRSVFEALPGELIRYSVVKEGEERS